MTYLSLYNYSTIDDGTWVLRGFQSSGIDSTERWANGTSSLMLDVTDTSLCKVKFVAYSPNANTISGDTTYNQTSFEFYKLGDT